jgi:hypothetical protein
MATASRFDHDLFVSSAHVDDIAGRQGWVAQLEGYFEATTHQLQSFGSTLLKALAVVLIAATASAQPDSLCQPDSSVTPGVIRDKWISLGGTMGPLGCPLSDERDVVDNDGRVRQFLHGQVAWSPVPRLIVAVYERAVADGGAADIFVDGDVKEPFHYDFFNIRWTVEGEDTNQTKTGSGQDGRHVGWQLSAQSGRFGIRIEGCDNGGFLQPSKCRQGFSNPAVVDAGYIDVRHTWDGQNDLHPASSIEDARNTLHQRHLIGVLRSCRHGFDGSTLNDDNLARALAKLDAADSELAGACLLESADPAKDLRASVNDWLATAEIKSNVGTAFAVGEGAAIGGIDGAVTGALVGAALGGPLGGLLGGAVGGLLGGAAVCSRSGEYDFALTHLIPIAYEFKAVLTGDVYHKIVNEFLNQTGGRDQVIAGVSRCGLTVVETENHVMMTEAARFLTNPLRLAQAEQDFPPGSNELLDAMKRFDNSENGLEDWMLQHLQEFLKNDFHEYNARPYERYTVKALQNLANYASGRVAIAATNVLDYEAARFEHLCDVRVRVRTQSCRARSLGEPLSAGTAPLRHRHQRCD